MKGRILAVIVIAGAAWALPLGSRAIPQPDPASHRATARAASRGVQTLAASARAAARSGAAAARTRAGGVPFTHEPRHDPRHNPNCAWDSKRSADWDGDGEPDHMVFGVAHNTSFPRQVVTKVWKPVTGQDGILFFGSNDGPDGVMVVMQGDHRMLGANPATDPEGDPEQQHNGAISARLDYDRIEDGRAPRADARFGIYEANHLVMACAASDGSTEIAACLAGYEIYRQTDEPCPVD